MNTQLFLTHLEDGEFSKIFHYFRENNAKFKGYKTFEDEYSLDNPKGTDLKRFKDRLTTFFNSCLGNEKQVADEAINNTNQNKLLDDEKQVADEGSSNTNQNKPLMSQIKKLIEQNKLRQALDLLSNTDDVIILKARLYKLEREELMNTISIENAGIERNRITHAFLQLLGDDAPTLMPPEPIQATPLTTDFAAIQKALNQADYATVIALFNKHYGDIPTSEYSTIKQTVQHYLAQGQMPPPATVQGVQILLNKLKNGKS